MTSGPALPRGISDRDRLAGLADSINDTARMARLSVTLMLLTALYMAIVILLATDENLFRDTAVTLPYLLVGISLKQSYLVAPAVFIWLHSQTLLLLAVLARKVDTFETALEHIFSDNSTDSAECRAWLSAFNFVRSVQDTGGVALGARVMVWTGIAWIPLLLLFLVDVSFVKYQSSWITAYHHIVFCFDLVFVCIFWLDMYRRRQKSDAGTKWRLLTAWPIISRTSHIVITKVPFIIFVLAAITLGLASLVFVWPMTYIDDQYDYDLKGERTSKLTETNFFDTVLCPRSRYFCRRLDLQRGYFSNPSDDRNSKDLRTLDTEERNQYRRSYTLDLSGRSFRFANLKEAYLSGIRFDDADLRGANLYEADMSGAQLRSANLKETDLKYADLSGADLRGAYLQGAKLEHAKFYRARVQTANLSGTQPRHTNMSGANLENAVLDRLDFEGTNFFGAWLQGASLQDTNLKRTNLSKANLENAVLNGAVLENAKLPGADLSGADLSKANLKGALLLGVRLSETQLDGANLESAIVAGAEGQPQLSGQISVKGVVWNTADLRGENCPEGDVRCYLDAQGVESDLALAWKPDVMLAEYLHHLVSRRHVMPDWLEQDGRPSDDQ